MKGFKKFLSLGLALAMVLTLAPSVTVFADEEVDDAVVTSVETSDSITILYTNDTHTYIDKALSYANVAALKQDLEAAGENVLLVDAGDHSQGTAYGGLDKGKGIIEIMNATGYDLATLGNHEFDYGMNRAFEIMREADFPYISLNFYDRRIKRSVLAPYKVFEIAGKKVAFVGISTPETIAKGTPTYFMNDNKQFIYDFLADDTGAKLYAEVQKTIDAAKAEADVVIALGHMGVDISSAPYRSTDIIANTTGLDAFIDGHSHTKVECESVKDKAGNTVILSQTGSYLDTIGQMTIEKDGKISSKLITEYENADETVAGMVEALIEDVDSKLGEVIAVNGNTPLYIYDKDDDSLRVIRRKETNLGDLTADAVYYYFNEKEMLDCDIAISNGGGIRSQVAAGADVSYNTLKKIHTFGNVVCLMEITGQQVLDMLEFGAKNAGVTKVEDGKTVFAESGGFLHVAGIKFVIDTTIEPTVQMDEKGLWKGKPTGSYRVKDVMVYDKAAKKYLPLDLKGKYTIGGINYILRELGDGFNMFEGANLIKDYVNEDYLVLAEYVKAFKKNAAGLPVLNSASSPLKAYEGYLLNYDNFEGAGRIAENAETAITYIVKKGDSLWKISKNHYGTGAKYNVIYEANKDQIKNPNRIYVNQVLKIPSVAA